ncbi:hypothetical protein Goshw_016251 [Gossypium schwendimanii]|uniref:Uncharacterized protein n=1 Tax=Gossypium schwendimanii TaxID=34291 RepID=A0A7J9N1K5_GOSSC|nr:hypothetical protein [Gossypium schwendimanii]
MQIEGTVLPRMYRGRSSGKVARDNATRHSGGEVEQRGVQKLSEAMTIVESVVKLGLGKDNLGSSKPEEKDV